MRILVTNDDGVSAPGLIELARALDAEGFDVLVVGPLGDYSGCGTALNALHREPIIEYEQLSVAGLNHVPVYGIAGTPSTAVLAACLGGFGSPPRFVVSGINAGLNAGGAVLHSGTVGAALTAARLRRPALAISLDTSAGPPQWATAAAVAVTAVDWVVSGDDGGAFNINVPNQPAGELSGVANAAVEPPSASNAAFVAAGPGRLRLETWARDDVAPPGSDTALIADGFVTISPLGAFAQRATAAIPADDFMVDLQAIARRLSGHRERARRLERAG